MTLSKLPPEVIRKHKGISFPGVTTIFYCHDGKGMIFLTKRSKNTRDEHGHWDVGGGGLKYGVSVEDNLHRELKEEYNVVPLKSEFIGYFDAFRKNNDGDDTHWVALVFAVQIDPKKVKINEPENVDDFGWFDLNNLPAPMHSQFEPCIKKYGDKIKAIMGIKD